MIFKSQAGKARQVVGLVGRPSGGLGMAVEAADANVATATLRPLSEGQSGGSAPLVASAPIELKLTRESDGKLTVEGTKEQLDAAVRLLGQLKQ